ncbi:Ig-like domain-containing protein, partial [Escherichia coli]|nr:Ig-like domain-containing protein [Escherichia coli]
YQATVQADGSWSINIPAADLEALTDGSHTLTATVSDQAGNPGSASKGVTVDTTAPVISFNTVAGDDVVNIIEHGQALVITGSSSGLATGSNVTLTINGRTYVSAVLADGSW